MNLDQQPCYDAEEDTLSLRDLPLTTISSTSSTSSDDVTWDEHHQEVFEFFSKDFDPPSSHDNIIFCGKIIPYRASHDADHEQHHKKKAQEESEEEAEDMSMTTKRSNFHRKSLSLTDPARSSMLKKDNHNHGEVNMFWSLPLSHSASTTTSLRSRQAKRVSSYATKSRWYLLAFGVGKVSLKMDLDDIKLRQSKKMRSQMLEPNEQVVKGNKSSRKSSRGLLGILGCSREDANSMLKVYRAYFPEETQATPFLAGAAVAAAALAGKYGIQAWQSFKARPPKMRRFYEGGFQAQMTRREAALILGLRESAAQDKIKEAHRRVMVANHPDAGGSDYLASKINEAKDVMLGKTKGSGSAF
ncbi:Mitochondrial import inner membrane translocase subunit TIM14-1 [Linum perenne]